VTYEADPYRLIEKYDAGQLVNAAASDIASAIEHFASLPTNELQRMGANARQLIEKEFSWEPIAKTILAACEEACSRKSIDDLTPSKGSGSLERRGH